jgi:hydrogenase maturation protease
LPTKTLPDRPIPLLVLGLGNVLCGDDGLGAVAVNLLLRGYEAPEDALVLDGGTLGLSLLHYLEDAETVILVDAIRADGPPGAPVRLEGDEVAPAVAARLSVHQVGVWDLLEVARLRGRYPPRLVLLGLVPLTLDLGLGLSPSVREGLPHLVDRIVAEARALGYALLPRAGDEEPSRRPGDLAVAHGL